MSGLARNVQGGDRLPVCFDPTRGAPIFDCSYPEKQVFETKIREMQSARFFWFRQSKGAILNRWGAPCATP